jgi:peptidoglycan hydrolase-like protein with peptidoglycan-binding domain
MMTTKLKMVMLLVGGLFAISIVKISLQTPVFDNAAYAGSRINQSQNQMSYPYNMVQKAQRVLRDLGYNPGPIDGLWGPKTSSAVREFQMDNDLTVSGMLDMETRQKLFKGN